MALGAGGWLYRDASGLQTSYENVAKEKADAYAARARIAAKRRCVPLTPEAERDCIRDEAQAARQGQHDEYDLQAQLVTSAWTRAMGVAAVIAMSVGIFGVGLIFVTFRETRRTADSAEAGLEHAREMSRIQLRAYIHSEKETFTRDAEKPGQFVFVLPFRNVGETPARGVAAYTFVSFEEFRKPYPTGLKTTRKGKRSHLKTGQISFDTVSRGTPFNTYLPIYLNKKRVHQLENFKGILHMDVRMQFRDVFGAHWLYEQDFYVSTMSLSRGLVNTSRCRTVRHVPPEQTDDQQTSDHAGKPPKAAST